MTIQEVKEKINAADRAVLVGENEPWRIIARMSGLTEVFMGLMQKLEAAREEYRAASETLHQTPQPVWISLRHFAQDIKCRAGVVYRLAFGQQPKGRNVTVEFLQTLHPTWEQRYPSHAAMLREVLAPTLEQRAKRQAAEQAAAAAKALMDSATAELDSLQTSLVQYLWDEAVELTLPSGKIEPCYSTGSVEFRLSRSYGDCQTEVKKLDNPPVGSPFFLADLKAKLAGKPVRIFEPTSGRPVTGPEIRLGEEGRGRKLTRVPIIGAQEGQEVKAVYIGVTGNLVALKAVNPDGPINNGFVLLVLNFHGGCRGDVNYTYPDGAVCLASGYVAQGIAGRAWRLERRTCSRSS